MQKRLFNSAFMIALLWLGLRFLFISFVPLILVGVIKYITNNPETIEKITHYLIVPFAMVASFVVGYLYSYDTGQVFTRFMRLKTVFFIAVAEWLYRMNSFTNYIRLMVAKLWRHFDQEYKLFSSKEIFDAILFYSVLVLSAYIFLSLGSKFYRYLHDNEN